MATVSSGSNRTGSGDDRKWVRHEIDSSFSQSHALKLVDIDGDGQPELITGKRYRGHGGNDPGSYDPVVLYAYKMKVEGTAVTFTPLHALVQRTAAPVRNSSPKTSTTTATSTSRVRQTRRPTSLKTSRS